MNKVNHFMRHRLRRAIKEMASVSSAVKADIMFPDITTAEITRIGRRHRHGSCENAKATTMQAARSMGDTEEGQSHFIHRFDTSSSIILRRAHTPLFLFNPLISFSIMHKVKGLIVANTNNRMKYYFAFDTLCRY